jgi:hypothetical protein
VGVVGEERPISMCSVGWLAGHVPVLVLG